MMKYFLLSVFSILLIYSFVIHPFEVPDENAHFSSLTFLSQEGGMPNIKDDNNLTVEELKVERIFGIVEHENKYSYHPEYRMEYLPGLVGKYEAEIASLNSVVNRGTYDTFEAATYPPLYYLLTLPFYTLVKHSDILMRLFVSRFSSIILTVIMIYITYLVGLTVFAKKSTAITLAFMMLCFPMTTYLGAGVNSDNLHNLLFAVATLLAFKLIKHGLPQTKAGWSRNLSLGIGTVIGLDLITKPQAYILIPIFALAVIIRWRWDEWRSYLYSIFYILISVLIIAGWQEIPKLILGNNAVGATSYTARVALYGGFDNFKIFFSAYLKTHATEMIVWYWGVFKWFGVIMPKVWWWVANRLLGLSFIGLLITLFRDFRAKKFSYTSKYILFSIGANLIYIGALGWFDWQFYQEYGRSLGLQPRYYLPLLISQMYLFYLGLESLGWNKQAKEWIRRFVIFFFLGLQLTSFYTQLKSYYDVYPLNTLIHQISQYKPFFAKGAWWYLWFPIYFASTIYIAIFTLKSDQLK